MERMIEQRLRRLQIRCRRPVQHLLAGEYRSVFKGRGIEFEELREYQFGDDVRAIDWRSVARTGKAYIRRYVEEREQSFVLAVDVSASGAFGSGERTKREAAQECASLLAWSAARNNDRVGLLMFSDVVETYIPPARGRRQVLRTISELLAVEPKSKGTDIPAALDFLQLVTRKRGIVFLISDFLCEGYGDALSLLARRHDVTTVRVRDRGESRLPRGGLITLRDAESGHLQHVDLDAVETGRGQPDELASICESSEIDGFEIGPHVDSVEALSAYFRARQRRTADETGG